MDPVKVVVHGALGKMGQEVLRALCNTPAFIAVAGVDIKAVNGQQILPDGSRSIPLSADLESILEQHRPDVLVDFSTAKASMPALRTAVKHNVRLVIGTTGLSAADLDEIRSLCSAQKIGAVVAPNFSLAAIVMKHLAKIAARFFDYAEIIELHHEQKADAPSGTAVDTAREMVASRGKASLLLPIPSPSVSTDSDGFCMKAS